MNSSLLQEQTYEQFGQNDLIESDLFLNDNNSILLNEYNKEDSFFFLKTWK